MVRSLNKAKRRHANLSSHRHLERLNFQIRQLSVLFFIYGSAEMLG